VLLILVAAQISAKLSKARAVEAQAFARVDEIREGHTLSEKEVQRRERTWTVARGEVCCARVTATAAVVLVAAGCCTCSGSPLLLLRVLLRRRLGCVAVLCRRRTHHIGVSVSGPCDGCWDSEKTLTPRCRQRPWSSCRSVLPATRRCRRSLPSFRCDTA
jgi:hypothetical protein